MNRNFSLKHIYIENFKSIERLELDWTQNQLVVLDGPNGFGKTTIFDAIELVLSGKIDRIKKPEDARVSFNDVLFSNDSTRDLIIKIQFEYESKTITLAKVLPSLKRLTGIQKQPGRWEIFDTYHLETMNSPINEKNKITQDQLNALFNIDQFERIYSLFYYIQQQENTNFLKRPGKERLTEISRLFDTKEEEEEKDYLQNTCKFLEQEKRSLKKKIEETGKRIEQYKDQERLDAKEQVKYERLFYDSINKQWDREDIRILDKQLRDQILEELFVLEDFVINFDEFEKASFNKQLRQFAQGTELLGHTIQGKVFFSRFPEMEKMRERLRKVQSFITQLQDFHKNFSRIDFKALNEELKLELDIKAINEKIEKLRSRNGDISHLSKIVNELNNTRSRLITQMKSLHQHHHSNQSECPLCGFDWGNFDSLMNEIQGKSEYFSSLHNESAVIQNNEIEELYERHIKTPLSELNLVFNLPENQISEAFYRVVEAAKHREDDVAKFLIFCEQNNIGINEYFNIEYNSYLDDEKLNIQIGKLSSFLLGYLKTTKEGYSEFDQKHQIFSRLYKELFEESTERLALINQEKINSKKLYIDWVFYNQMNSNLQNELNKLTKYQENHKKLSKKVEELNQIITQYGLVIKQHWKNIMTDIEIPFYVYSGKIMQNYQRGLGLFVKETSDLDSIIFVSDIKSDHDALNYLSSGQLSALVISFTLALNKIYGHKDLGILLIDDPVQSMDEINMASLTELLRNDFSHKQIIISTHEEDVSRYLQYKFSKYGFRPSSFNMREQAKKGE
ncbi:AAA family ATPase [Paenibacillus xylanexedens]|uniref:ATP-binding protein n=1 Tax=Paenibacillus xylanexedens TaxID=528191 RepID=UPI003CFD0069